ncbi:TIM barrel protein [Microbacterium barkeri]|uniref:sugar phosphate isomerase/epimerase family protein n=1 Tax=Microbacterium barkeri TaxID=33917 RepID=UPI0024AF6728|nr:TIM barrel protein [Microbacterium barkeri]MDI6943266.1 TIM barrel protein [Microbacterium barkeri]
MSAIPFQLGVSVYSYTGDFGVVMDLDDCARDIADLGATGIEILGEGHVESYPEPSAAFIDAWHARNAELGLTPTLYGSWLDTRRFPGRGMTVEEGAEQLALDLRLAATLGFSFVRPKIGVVTSDLQVDPIWDQAVERNLDLAHDLGLTICPEIHWPSVIKSPVVDEYIAFIERTGTENFGLLIDTGVFQKSMFRREEPGITSQLGTGGVPAFPVVPVVPVSDLRDVMPYTVYFQAKFHEIDDDLVDHHIPWAEIIDVVLESGYTGWLSSEYEGHKHPYRASDQLRCQHALIRALAAERQAAAR